MGTSTATRNRLCICGQDLELVERDHCPRCGCELHRDADGS